MKKSVYTSVAAAALLATVATPLASTFTGVAGQTTVSAANTAQQQAFIAQLAPYAMKHAVNKGLYPSLAIAQAIHESGWGESLLASQYHNLFGMKFKDGQDEGKYGKIDMTTNEVLEDGVLHTVSRSFRTYDSFEGSIADYADKMRYAVGLPAGNYNGTWIENADTPEQAAQGLFPKTNGFTGKYDYATGGRDGYVANLVRLINTYNLKRFDPQMTTINKTMYINSTTGMYNTYTPVKQQIGSAVEGQAYKVSRMVTLADKSSFYEIGKGQWVLTSKMSTSKTNNFEVKPMSGIVTIHEPHNWGVALWDNPNGSTIPNRHLAPGTSWKVSGKAEFGAKIWYRVGTNQWIDAQYATVKGETSKPEANKPETNKPQTGKETPASGIGAVSYVPNYYVFLRDENGAMTSQKLKHGARYKVFAKKEINGKLFYRLGTQKQWMEAKYLKF